MTEPYAHGFMAADLAVPPSGCGDDGAPDIPASPSRSETLRAIRQGRWLKKARRGERKLRRRIEAALARGETGKREVRRYLTSHHASVVAADHYNADRARKGRAPLSKLELRELIRESRGWHPIDEPVRATVPSKGRPGAFRVTFSLGRRRRLRQILAGNALRPFRALLHPDQTVLQGARAGRPAWPRSTWKWVVEADIRDHFGSFDRKALPGLLPFPQGFTQAMINLEGVDTDIRGDEAELAELAIHEAQEA